MQEAIIKADMAVTASSEDQEALLDTRLRRALYFLQHLAQVLQVTKEQMVLWVIQHQLDW